MNIGDVDAGFIPEHALHKADRYIAPGAIIAVVKTAPLPNWVVSVSRNMPRIQKEDLREILLNLTEQDPVLTSLGVSSFHNVSDADYDIIRDLVE